MLDDKTDLDMSAWGDGTPVKPVVMLGYWVERSYPVHWSPRPRVGDSRLFSR